jgi:hypothetical protein
MEHREEGMGEGHKGKEERSTTTLLYRRRGNIP